VVCLEGESFFLLLCVSRVLRLMFLQAAKLSKEYEAKGGEYENEAGSKNEPKKGAPTPKSDEKKDKEVKGGNTAARAKKDKKDLEVKEDNKDERNKRHDEDKEDKKNEGDKEDEGDEGDEEEVEDNEKKKEQKAKETAKANQKKARVRSFPFHPSKVLRYRQN
jgi:hypothetical protein